MNARHRRQPQHAKKPATHRRSRGRANPASKSEEPASASRALWSGAIAFGLVQIPVRLVNAETPNELSLHQLDRRDNGRIHYKRVNAETGKEVEWDDIVKGYQLDDGNYVLLEDEDFEKASVEATHTIDIQSFVNQAEIPPAYFERPYYLVPDKGAKKAYAVLRDALAKKGYVAIALIVIRTRQHLCAIMADGPVLILETLRFKDELKPASAVKAELPTEVKVSPKEVALSEQLVESLAAKWDPAEFKDQYREVLLKAIAHKAKTGKMPPIRAHRGAPKNVTDLVALLQESLAKHGKSKDAA